MDIVQRDSLVHGKLQGVGRSSRVHHGCLKTGKSGWCREAVRVSPGWRLTTAQTLPASLWPSLQVTAGLAKPVVRLKRKLPSTLTIKSFKNTHQQLPCFSVPCAPRSMPGGTVSKLFAVLTLSPSCKSPSYHTRLHQLVTTVILTVASRCSFGNYCLREYRAIQTLTSKWKLL